MRPRTKSKELNARAREGGPRCEHHFPAGRCPHCPGGHLYALDGDGASPSLASLVRPSSAVQPVRAHPDQGVQSDAADGDSGGAA